MQKRREEFLRGLLSAILIGGAVGCSSTTATLSPASPEAPAGVGVTVSTPSTIPNLNAASYNFSGVNSASDLSALKVERRGGLKGVLQQALTKNADSSSAKFSEAFCNQKQCLLETLRHSLGVETFTCFLRKISDAQSSFTFGDGQYNYFNFDVSGAGAKGTETFSIQSRLRSKDSVLVAQVCEAGASQPFNELVIKGTTISDTAGINAVVTEINDDSTGKNRSQVSFATNCKPEAFFTNATCKVDFSSKFQDPMGKGNIDFNVSGGTQTSEVTHHLEANFGSSGSSASTGGSNVKVKSEWAAGTGATGATNVDTGDGGTYPAIPASDLTKDTNGSIFTICPKAKFYCDNPTFDPSKFDAANPTCPYVALSDGLTNPACPIPASQAKFTDCYSISGIALVDQTGTVLDCGDSTVEAHKTAVESGTTLDKETTIAMQESWDCQPEGTATTLDLTGVDFTECFNDLQDSESSDVSENSCYQQSAEADQTTLKSDVSTDTDGDGVKDLADNCPFVANASQTDTDGNGVGDACEGDFDGDGISDSKDNCPYTANADQKDTDGNGVGDACASFADNTKLDNDGDGIPDNSDNCPFEANADQKDTDGDGIGDPCDECPNDATNTCFLGNDVSCSSPDLACSDDIECQFQNNDTTSVCTSGCCVKQ